MKYMKWLLLASLLVSIAVACAPAAAPTPQVVKETVVVRQTVPPVKETVVVPQTVVVPAPTGAPVPTAAPVPVALTLYNPTGGMEVTQTFAPRLADLNGKTICEVSNGLWEASRTLPLVASLLQKQFPTVKIIAYDQFPANSNALDLAGDKISDQVKAKGCQGVILGNAG